MYRVIITDIDFTHLSSLYFSTYCMHAFLFSIVFYCIVITCVCQCVSIKKLDDDDDDGYYFNVILLHCLLVDQSANDYNYHTSTNDYNIGNNNNNVTGSVLTSLYRQHNMLWLQ